MERIHIMPYTSSDGVPTYRDSEIREFYNQVIEEGWGDIVFFDGSIQGQNHFLQKMKPNQWGESQNMLHIVYYKGIPAAMVWLNRFEKTHCYVHWLFFKAGRRVTKEIGIAVLEFLFNNYEVETLMGITPSFNKLALRFLKSIGLTSSCEIPGILWSSKKGKAIPGHMMFINRGEEQNESHNESSN
jgi:hypothetical protein